MSTLVDLIADVKRTVLACSFADAEIATIKVGHLRQIVEALSARLTPPAEVVLEIEPAQKAEWRRALETGGDLNLWNGVMRNAPRSALAMAVNDHDTLSTALAASEAKRKEAATVLRRIADSLDSAKASTTNDQYYGHVRQARSIARAALTPDAGEG